MSHPLISRSEDLLRLRDEGFDIEVRDGYLLVKSVPYVNADGLIRTGTLVSKLTLAGDVTATPEDHVVLFSGEEPCDNNGGRLAKIINSSGHQVLAEGLEVDHTFSSKPPGGYPDYHVKMTAYVDMLLGYAQAIDPEVTARTYPVIAADDEDDSVFEYIDTASSRVGIAAIAKKLELSRVAVVGLGGTGSYVFDLVAKTWVREIHLFDGDAFLQHNAFRCPGAPTIDELIEKPSKVDYLFERYSSMRRGIVVHPEHVSEANVDLLGDMDFVFLCLDSGDAKRLIIERLEDFKVAFVDVGMGIYEQAGSLGGIVRTTTSTPDHRGLAREHIPLSGLDQNNDYSQNIQIADLNALNAALAVIRWKKLFGFYADLENEHHSLYTLDGNHLLNEASNED